MERLRKNELKTLLCDGKIETERKFILPNWPIDPLISVIKPIVTSKVYNFVKTLESLFDPQDLKYQVLFRLTTYNIKELFINGNELENYLVSKGAYLNWRNILGLDKNFIEQFRLDEGIISYTIEEQFKIIENRLLKSDLPLDKIFAPTFISAEQNWYIHKEDGILIAAQGRQRYDRSQSIRLEVHEVDLQYANAIFRDLHYIHTPRAKVAIGLFKFGDEIPLSVIGMAPIDRNYKKDALLLEGYDPEKGWEITRLYSRPGVPMNTSSIMFAQAVKCIRTNYPDIQACFSAFTPSFASGHSMLGGGLCQPCACKTTYINLWRCSRR